MNTDDRNQLARQQHDMLKRLLQPNTAPPPTDPGHLRHAAETLAAKRRRELSLAIPDLCEKLADRFPPLVSQFASITSYPKRGGPNADAANFCRWLLKSPALTPDLLPPALAIATRRHWAPRLLRAHGKIFFAWRGRVF